MRRRRRRTPGFMVSGVGAWIARVVRGVGLVVEVKGGEAGERIWTRR